MSLADDLKSESETQETPLRVEEEKNVIVIKLNDQNQQKQAQKHITSQQGLVQSAEYQRLKEQLKQKLIESGWQELVKEKCKQKIRENDDKILDKQELVQLVEKQAQIAVPNEVKAYLLGEIREFLNNVN